MKKSGKICLYCNIICCVCVLLIVAAITSFYIFVIEAKKPDPGFCTRTHAAQAVECAKKDDELGAAAASMNHTNFLLFPPNVYAPLLDLCRATLDCAREIKCKSIRNILNDMSICSFIHYYTKEFSECADALYKNRNNIDCLSEIYNEKTRNSEETCQKWKTITPCMKESIKKTCDDRLGILQFKWETRAKKANMVYCKGETENFSVNSDENDV